MRIAIGADHAGFALKQRLGDYLRELGHEVTDVGTVNRDPVDYPDYAEAVAKTILEGKAERAVLICGSGVGASVAANKLPGIRAAVCHDTYSARQGVEHDDMNILVLGARIIGEELAHELCGLFSLPSLRRKSAIFAVWRKLKRWRSAMENRCKEKRHEPFERITRTGTIRLAGLYSARSHSYRRVEAAG
jgi:ribose 5-phosphate isomerase B